MNFGSGDGACCVILLILSDVTHSGLFFGNKSEVTEQIISSLKVNGIRYAHLRFVLLMRETIKVYSDCSCLGKLREFPLGFLSETVSMQGKC